MVLAMSLNSFANAQTKLFSKNAVVSFYSATTMENIDAKNEKGLVVWDKATGNIEFSVLMKGFVFKKALMQEHFNENYVESDKFPKAVFKGTIDKNSSIDFTKDQSFSTFATGTLTMHGVSKAVKAPVSVTIKKGVVSSVANFSVLLSDYNIKVPGVVKDKISNKIDIRISVPSFSAL